MDKYAKLFKGLEMCAGPECSTECPYHGETRGAKTCRAWLLNDAAVALVKEESRAAGAENKFICMRERCMVQQNEINALVLKLGKAKDNDEKGEVLEAAKELTKLIADASYWRGQADALKWFLHDRFDRAEDCADAEQPEAEAGNDV